MDVDLRLIALKKAYSDVIMNTIEEAASRILVYERKAAHFQHELNVAREQGVQTLRCLKQIMDSKVFEAEMISSEQQRKIEELTLQLLEAENIINESELTSFNQQAKIDELEAQLQEAEDIVKDLRDEIPYLQAQLKRAKLANQNYLAQINSVDLEQKTQTNSISMPVPASEDPAIVVKEACVETVSQSTPHEIVVQTKDLASSSLNGSISGNDSNKPTLPTIGSRNKVSEPFRNRRTQSILAFEEKLMAGELCFRNPIDNIVEEVLRKNKEEDVDDCKTAHKRKGTVQKRSISKKKRNYRKPKTSSLRLLAEQALIIEQASSVSDGANHCANQVDNNVFLIKQENDGMTDLTEKHDSQEAKPIPNRVIKYTYQRKQKKVSLKCKFDGNASHETELVKEALVENQNSPMETEFSLSTVSDQNSQHVAQIDHHENAVEETKMM